MIIIHNLTKVYKSKTQDEDVAALDDLTLFLPDKGFIAIYGASGCGKSTLLNILGGLDQADSGTMIVNGRNTKNFTRHDWNSYRNQQVGFIFQNYFLLPHLNVHDNIAITLEMAKQTKDMDKKIRDALAAVDMTKFSKRYPKQLSGGQQQRVAIARALISNPAIILADEPTGALDEKSSKIVMENLRTISKNHLVVMVTHNERMAKEYADRMIEISYGKIINDENIQPETDDIENNEPLLKVHLPLKSSISWSIRNVIKKKGRSIPIAIASAIGLAAAGIVLSMTKGVNDYVAEAQKRAIVDYPVYVSAYPKTSSESNKNSLELRPDDEAIIIEKSDYAAQEHYISMQNEFMNYMGEMPRSYYDHVHSNETINFNLFTKSSDTSFIKVDSTSYTTCIAPDPDTYSFINEQYEVLAGHLPHDESDLTLVIDAYNRIDLQILTALGFDTGGDDIKFSEVIGKEYKIVPNNDYYEQHVEDKEGFEGKHYYTRKGNTKYDDLYALSNNKTLRISGIIRPYEDDDNQIYNTILLYHPSLTNTILTQNQNSDIYKDQIAYNTTYDVFNRRAFSPYVSKPYEITENYQFESRLVDVGGKSRITALYYYTKSFEQRTNIIDYVETYIEEKLDKDSNIILRTRDYLESVTSSFSSLVTTFSTVLLIFSLVSIFVSVILTAILTYISVIERKREIGLLRSLGARRLDVSLMFIMEAAIIGIAAGVLGIGLCYGLSPIVAKVVVNLISFANTKILSPSPASLSQIQPWLIPAMFIAAIEIGIVSSLVPAIIAGSKKPADSLKE